MANYFSERDKNITARLRNLRNQLPECCEDFFVGIEPQTTTLTRLNYAYDLRIFFDYLLKNVRAFRDYQDVLDFTAEDLDKVTLGNLEAYMEYLSYYTFEGKEKTNAEKGKSRKNFNRAHVFQIHVQSRQNQSKRVRKAHYAKKSRQGHHKA